MIENLSGIFEKVQYKQSTSIKLYNNSDYEDYPYHWHTVPEIIMPIDNIYTVEINGITTVLQPEDIAFISPGCLHALYAPTTGLRIIFQPDVAPLRFMKEVETLLTLQKPFFVITKENHPEIHDQLRTLMYQIRDEYLADEPFSEVSIYGKTLQILTLLGKNLTGSLTEATESGTKGHQEEYVEAFLSICDYISAHCCEDLTLEQVADLSGFSKFYFSRLFKQFTNVTFYRYVNQKRIALAEERLTDPSKTITDVAISCGFPSLSSFIRMFKIIKGCTPTDFRTMYKSF